MMFLFGVLACYNQVMHFQRVDISGVLTSQSDILKPIYLSAHHAWFGEGSLRVPASEFDSMLWREGDSFSWTIDVPLLDEAEGLLLYAWQDLDGDGVFCGFDAEDEYSDLVEVLDFPTFEATVVLNLTRRCQPSENLWGEEGIPVTQ